MNDLPLLKSKYPYMNVIILAPMLCPFSRPSLALRILAHTIMEERETSGGCWHKSPHRTPDSPCITCLLADNAPCDTESGMMQDPDGSWGTGASLRPTPRDARIDVYFLLFAI